MILAIRAIVSKETRLGGNTMKKYLMVLLVALLSANVLVTTVFAQATGSVKGVVRDADGKPVNGALVRWLNQDNGRKYEIKTNSKGEYFSLGIMPGTYKAVLMVDGKEVFHLDAIHVGIEELGQDFDLQKEQENSAKAKGISPEVIKQQQEQQREQAEKQQKEVVTVKSLNERLTAANVSMKAGDYDAAISTLTEATQMDATRDVLWAGLADAYAGAAMKQTDPAQKTKMLDQSIQDYQKAVDLKKKSMESGAKPDANVQLAAMYNNMARAKTNAGKVDEAIQDYDQAAKLNPAAAGTYYFNMGATLTNINKTNDPKIRQSAIDAFDKAIAADPNHADAYYYKATNMVGGATLQGTKMVAPDGTAEAFNKYLELQPTGPHAEDSKAMLASLGAPVETTYGTTKKKPKK
jgi:tetratricopeptide (TPR) repeat protein